MPAIQSTPAARSAASSSPASMSMLLGRYISGRIEDDQWNFISSYLDAPACDAADKAAFAAFCLDAFASGEELWLSAADDVTDLLPDADA